MSSGNDWRGNFVPDTTAKAIGEYLEAKQTGVNWSGSSWGSMGTYEHWREQNSAAPPKTTFWWDPPATKSWWE